LFDSGRKDDFSKKKELLIVEENKKLGHTEKY
jgi:hypothetical protein